MNFEDLDKLDCDPVNRCGDYEPNEDRERYIAEMTDKGFEVKYPLPNELQIDIDEQSHYLTYLTNIKILQREFPDIKIEEHTSRGGSGKHVSILMPFDLTNVERIAWQAAMGSDPMREILSLIRDYRGDEFPTLFVERQ